MIQVTLRYFEKPKQHSLFYTTPTVNLRHNAKTLFVNLTL